MPARVPAFGDCSCAKARADLDGLPGGRRLNICYEAVDRHAAGPRAAATALRCIARDGTVTELSYASLRAQTSRFANLLQTLGVGKGDRVFSLLGREPELYVAALGTLKNTSVFSPLFPAFGPEPIRQRLSLGDGKVLVTSPQLYERRIAPKAGVIGKPDPVAGEMVQAFVTVKRGTRRLGRARR